MTIGLDLTSLQGPHRMRGVGYTLINFINNLPSDLTKKHKFVFYYYTGESYDSPLGLLNLKKLHYETRQAYPPKSITKALPGRLNILIKLLSQLISLKEIYLGDSRIQETSGLDVFLQTDQMISLPRGRHYKKVFIAYDLIPYILEWDYLWNYKTARINNLPVQAAVRCSFRRWLYLHKLRINSRRANTVIAISDVTRNDFLKYIGLSGSKIITIPLGINVPKVTTDKNTPELHRYLSSSWGYLKRPFRLDYSIPYLLFVGGADHRRKLDDLVTAFNHLRAQGCKLQLVLAGDIMQGPSNIPVHNVQKAFKESSYLGDIIFMGFINDEQRDWLYKHALAFVFPSLYEGFGIPVLEAMVNGCPVISYKNSVTQEVANNYVMYADSSLEIVQHVKNLLRKGGKAKTTMIYNGIQHSQKYTWGKTSKSIIKTVGVENQY